jgi:hypothetical protein
MLRAIAADIGRGRTIMAVAAALTALTVQGLAQSRAQASPFDGLQGSWAGNGTVTTSNGTKEKIRCLAQYYVGSGGNTLRQDLRCASASYKFDLSGDVTNQGGTLTGQWSEATRNTGGTVSGSVMGNGQIRAVVDGPGFSAILSVATRGNRQSVQFVSQGQETTVSIALARRE